MTYQPNHNYFDFKNLPVELNNIINTNAQEIINTQNRELHKAKLQPTLDLINSLEKRYSADMNGIAYVIYALDVEFEEECILFSNNEFIFSFPIEVNITEALLMNEDHIFDDETETDDEENMDMEDPSNSDEDIEMN